MIVKFKPGLVLWFSVTTVSAALASATVFFAQGYNPNPAEKLPLGVRVFVSFAFFVLAETVAWLPWQMARPSVLPEESEDTNPQDS